MNDTEALVLLTRAALLDPRMKRVDPVEHADMATAWAEVLHDVDLEPALTAVAVHYRSSREPIMPADVLALVGVPAAPSPYRSVDAELSQLPAIAGEAPIWPEAN